MPDGEVIRAISDVATIVGIWGFLNAALIVAVGIKLEKILAAIKKGDDVPR